MVPHDGSDDHDFGTRSGKPSLLNRAARCASAIAMPVRIFVRLAASLQTRLSRKNRKKQNIPPNMDIYWCWASNSTLNPAPTALAKPCPKGPVVTSTPLVIRNSGCPGVLLPGKSINSFHRSPKGIGIIGLK